MTAAAAVAVLRWAEHHSATQLRTWALDAAGHREPVVHDAGWRNPGSAGAASMVRAAALAHACCAAAQIRAEGSEHPSVRDRAPALACRVGPVCKAGPLVNLPQLAIGNW